MFIVNLKASSCWSVLYNSPSEPTAALCWYPLFTDPL